MNLIRWIHSINLYLSDARARFYEHSTTHLLEIDWATCSKVVDYFGFNSQHNRLGINMIGIGFRGNYMIIQEEKVFDFTNWKQILTRAVNSIRKMAISSISWHYSCTWLSSIKYIFSIWHAPPPFDVHGKKLRH